MKIYQVKITNNGWVSNRIHTTEREAKYEAFDCKYNEETHVLINVYSWYEPKHEFILTDNIAI